MRQVLNSGRESQQSIGKFLAVPALRRVISTFANVPSGQFADWSTNPQVGCRSVPLTRPRRGMLMALQTAQSAPTARRGGTRTETHSNGTAHTVATSRQLFMPADCPEDSVWLRVSPPFPTQVLQMLSEAKRMLDEGCMTEAELDHNLTLQLQVRPG